MKSLVKTALFMLISTTLLLGNNKYDKAMSKAMSKLNEATTLEDYNQVANQFDRIASATEDEWLPVYYVAYTRVMMAVLEEGPKNKDTFLDEAQKKLDILESMDHDVPERLVLQGFHHMIRISVDPGSRGATLGQDCGMVLNQAYQMNNQNPRVLLMLAQFNFGASSYMGTDTSGPCAMFDEALKLFESPRDSNSDKFLPSWGKDMTLVMQKQCQG